jgi:outer membrane protein assembly factor BamB
MKQIFILLNILIILCGCSKEDDTKDKNGIVIGKKALWTTAISIENQLSNNFMFKPSIIYKNGVLIRIQRNKNDLLRFVDINDGSTKWEWSDYIEKYEFYGVNYPFLNANKLTWQADYCNYQIDLDNGKTIWKNLSPENYNYDAKGVDNTFFTSHLVNRNAPIESGGYVVVMDNNTGKPIFKFKPSYDTIGKGEPNDCNWSYEGLSVPFRKNDTIYNLIKYNDPPLGCTKARVEWLGLFNYNAKEWVYRRKKLKNKDLTAITPHPSVIYKDKVYHSNIDNLTCHDLMNGEKIWETALPSQGNYFQSAGILLDNDKVYANSDGGQLFCLNAKGGNILWQIRSSGSSTALSYLKGVVYFVGGGDGNLHAVDAETGEYLWKIESPDKAKNRSAIFSGMCAVVPGVGSEKGKIVVTTGLNAYCYEAIR